MTTRVLVPAVAGLVATVSIAVAETLPDWKIGEICARESAPGQCAAFEGEAQRTLSGSWSFVLEAIRQGCLAQAKTPADQSYRLLADCVDNGTLRALDRQAVKTAATPAEPVPPPKPVEAERSRDSASPQAQPASDGQKSDTAPPAAAQPKQ